MTDSDEGDREIDILHDAIIVLLFVAVLIGLAGCGTGIMPHNQEERICTPPFPSTHCHYQKK